MLEPRNRQGNHREAEERSEQADTKKDPKRSHIIFYIALFSVLVCPALTQPGPSPSQSQTQPQSQSQHQQSSLPADAPAGVMRLTLDQAVALALKQNTTAQIAVLTAGQANKSRRFVIRIAAASTGWCDRAVGAAEPRRAIRRQEDIPGFPGI